MLLKAAAAVACSFDRSDPPSILNLDDDDEGRIISICCLFSHLAKGHDFLKLWGNFL